MIVNTPFFISPAYSVPRITISPRSKLEVDAGLRGHARRVAGRPGTAPAL